MFGGFCGSEIGCGEIRSKRDCGCWGDQGSMRDCTEVWVLRGVGVGSVGFKENGEGSGDGHDGNESVQGAVNSQIGLSGA